MDPNTTQLRASLRRLYHEHKILTEAEARHLCAAIGIPEDEVLDATVRPTR